MPPRQDAGRRNVECKATDPDPERSAAVCRQLGADDAGILHQRDTYFEVPRGRLKLREQTPGGAQLIHYTRADATAERLSAYRIAEIPDGGALRAALADALDTPVVVDKRRHLWLWRGVRIHLDDVDGLGSFVELEAVAPPESDLSHEHELVAHLRERLGITDDRLCPRGYADLLRDAGAAGGAP